MPSRNGWVAEAPEDGHITQCGATSDTVPADAADEDVLAPPFPPNAVAAGADVDSAVPALVLPADVVDAEADADVPVLDPVPAADIAAVVDVVDVVAVDVVEGVVEVIAGRLTPPDDPLVTAAPATPSAAVAVWAAAGPASTISSGSAMRRSWAMVPSNSEPDGLLSGIAGLGHPRRAGDGLGPRHHPVSAVLPRRCGADRMKR